MLVERGRKTVDHEGDVVVFLIGMRVNRWVRPDLWVPVAMRMPAMLRELEGRTDLGFLGAESWFGNPTIAVMYWSSAEALIEYARSRDHLHLPAWVDFRRRVGASDAVGVWHETYRVPAKHHEAIYVNMPAFGLGRIGRLVPAEGAKRHASERLALPSALPPP